MAYYVYIIQSEKDGSFYKGFSENYLQRLNQYNNGWSRFTSRKMPWKLVYVEEHALKTSVLNSFLTRSSEFERLISCNTLSAEIKMQRKASACEVDETESHYTSFY